MSVWTWLFGDVKKEIPLFSTAAANPITKEELMLRKEIEMAADQTASGEAGASRMTGNAEDWFTPNRPPLIEMSQEAQLRERMLDRALTSYLGTPRLPRPSDVLERANKFYQFVLNGTVKADDAE